MNENNKVFHIFAPAVNTDLILQTIEQKLKEKKAAGAYECKTPWHLYNSNSSGEEKDIEAYINLIKESIFVDINDFEINDRHSLISPLLIFLKKIIWKCLKFYTYRLWKQQNDINGLIMCIIDAIEEKYKHKLILLETRIKEIEKQISLTKPS